ncbi:class IV adenylate cyclase [Stygiolobus caldivivus]|uniref:CYTH domain-containing protein n=1 Tax=Stygiolobus caldivivus TaxID=2824673 RepID=A0A8D5U7N3_9CREN|nr:class IV adenylate cyclase [Stygiolobus caldivivus]BCU70565.1 CYTH domain-containing protein [Stygiolobus caldivivus]
MTHIEREVKIKLFSPSLETLLTEFKSKYTFINEENQKDIYYNSPVRDFRFTDEALRIRKNNNRIELTYKGPKLSSQSKSRLEINVQVSSLEDMDTILQKLGFKKVIELEKTRWNFKVSSYTISLDNVKGLGNFLEIEGIDVDEKELLDFVSSFIRENQIKGEQTLKSYLELLVEKNEKADSNPN